MVDKHSLASVVKEMGVKSTYNSFRFPIYYELKGCDNPWITYYLFNKKSHFGFIPFLKGPLRQNKH